VETYDLKQNMLLHDKYEEIERELKDRGIGVTSNPEYSRVEVEKFIRLGMKAAGGKIEYAWELSLNDYLAQILMLFALLLLANTDGISSLVWKLQTPVLLKDYLPDIILTVGIVIAVIGMILNLPSVLRRRLKRMEEIRRILAGMGVA
jgi:hypothetical protein